MKEQKRKLLGEGKCGAEVGFTVEEEGERVILTVSGKGDMTDWIENAESPFYPYRDAVTDIVICEGVTSIGNYAFRGFPALERIDIAGSVVYYGGCDFDMCQKLTSLTVKEGTEVIGPKCFEKCTALSSVSFPSTLKAIDFKAFRTCDALTDVRYNGTAREWKDNVRISMSSLGNEPIVNADIKFNNLSKKYLEMTSKLAKIVAEGGDGRLYIASPDLTVPGVKEKSGDTTLIIFPDGETMLIDCGVPSSGIHMMDFIKAVGIRKLDYFVLSHPHVDHVGSWKAVCEYFCETTGGGIGKYLYSGFNFKVAEGKLSKYLGEHGTEIHRDIHAGDRITVGGVEISVFNPDVADFDSMDIEEKDVNNVSLAMRFVYGDSTFLASGDLFAKHERTLAARYGERLRADVAKCNHHGCFTSNSEEWLNAVQPKIMYSPCDDVVCTRLEENFARHGIKIYKVSDFGLTVISMGKNADYTVDTEYKG